MANVERTGWRDQALSARHRTWGKEFSAFDLDFILVEYDYRIPCALVEYKNESAPKQDMKSANNAALIMLGDMACLPVFCVRYAKDFSWWKIIPLNSWACAFVDSNNERPIMDEEGYKKFLLMVKSVTISRLNREFCHDVENGY
jgi:hypothetical protein